MSTAKPAGAACAQCPAQHAKCVPPEWAQHTQPTDVSGLSPVRPRARLAIVGEAPGRTELAQGRPFIGKSGQMLMRGLRHELHVDRSQVHWTNAVLCECSIEDQPKAAKACAARLRAELAAAGAPVVMPVGAWGLASTLGLPKKPQILRWRGSISEIDFGSGVSAGSNPTTQGATRSDPSGEAVTPTGTGDTSSGVQLSAPAGGTARRAFVCPTVHPAFVMRSPGWGAVLERDVARVRRVLRHGWTPPELAPDHRIIVARDMSALRQGLEALAPAQHVAFDVETVGLGPTQTLLVCFALSDGNTTMVVPWSRGRDGREPWWPEPFLTAGAVTYYMKRWTVVTHNGPAFDHIVARRYGLRIAAWDDTLLAYHALHSHLPKNLAHVVTQHIDVGPWKLLEDRTADLERLWTYNARDTLYTLLAWKAIRAELQEAA